MKRRAARAAVERVDADDVVGLGSGSTAAHAIRALGERVADGDSIVGIPTSYQSADLARSVGIPVRTPADVAGIDIAIDGADQVVGSVLIKGGGGAQTREKVIDAAAETFLCVVDETKWAEQLDHPVPIEVLSDARPLVMERIREIGGSPTVRLANDRPFITDNGNQIIDADFGRIEQPAQLATRLAAIPGTLEHGLFVDLVDTVVVGTTDDVILRSQ